MYDLHTKIRTKAVVTPVAIGANGTISGLVIDRQGYGGVEFDVAYGSVTTTGSTVTVVVKDGDATGALTSVSDTYLLGTETLASLAAGARVAGTGKEVAKRIGYVGNKRYVTVNLVKAGTTSVGAVSVNAILHNPELEATDNP